MRTVRAEIGRRLRSVSLGAGSVPHSASLTITATVQLPTQAPSVDYELNPDRRPVAVKRRSATVPTPVRQTLSRLSKHHFCLKYICSGTPEKSHLSRILFSRNRR